MPAGVLLANRERLWTQTAHHELEERKPPQAGERPVHRAVRYPALPGKWIEFLQSAGPAAQVVPALSELFTANPASRRPERKVSRRKPSLPRPSTSRDTRERASPAAVRPN